MRASYVVEARDPGLGFHTVLGLLRVYGLGLGVWGLGFGVWGLGFGVWGPELFILLGFRSLRLGV